MPKKTNTSRYMLIDGNALVHRGFHAIPFLTTKSGEQTNAVYGFTMILLRAIKELKPTHIACSFDLAGPTFRHEEYAEYKGTRVKAAQELYDQFPRVKEVVRGLNIPIFEIQGFEADDVLGTLATHICKEQKGCDVMIVTGDLDALQLVNECVKIYTLRKGLNDTAVYDEAAIKERYGLTPKQMISYKALRGDPSDNIKGVAGIGEKGAMQLIADFGSIDDLYKVIKTDKTDGKIKPRTLQLLIDQEEQARQSYHLSEIVCNVPLDIDIPEYEFAASEQSAIMPLFKELEFNSLVAKLPKTSKESSSKNQESSGDAEEVAKPKVDPNFKQKYEFIDTAEKLAVVMGKLESHKELALDTETTSLSVIDAKLVGISLSAKTGEAYYIPAKVVAESPELQKFLQSKDIKKIGHNIKYDYLVLQNAGIELGNVWFDTMIASYLLNAGTRQHGLTALAFNEFGYSMQPIEELIGKGKTQITMDLVEPEKVSWYACEDVDVSLRLKDLYAPKLEKENLDKVFFDIEMALIKVLARMERAGICVDGKLLGELSKTAEKQIGILEKEIYKLAGKEFNIASPKQMKEVLFEDMGLVSVTNKKTKTGLSTAAGELEKMVGQHDIIPKILQYREVSKLQSTYLLALPELINKTTGRIHTSYNQTIAATGRLSSTDPNLQNIPIRGTGLGSEVRKAFVAKPGYKLLSLDYSQIELRVAAHLADDANMKKIFNNHEDIHTNTAVEIFGVPEKEVTADMRRDAKTVNFGILYGLSSFGLSSRIGEVAWSDAKDFIDKYFAAYPGVKDYVASVKEEVNKNGYVKNELGRIRRFPEIKSSQYFIRQAAERAAVNFPIQSLAADVIKVAMLNIDKEIGDSNEEIQMLLQVHDELVFEVREDAVDKWAKKIKPLMEDAIKLSVPVTVEAKLGDNWGEMGRLEA